MVARAMSCGVRGLDGVTVTVEVDIAFGLPFFAIVGMTDTAVQESRERVRAAIRNSGFEFPMRRVAVSLAPADLRKAGPAYDLPIAIAILAASQQIEVRFDDVAFLGELSFNGSLRPTEGILPMVIAARDAGVTHVVVPAASAAEAYLVDGIIVWPCTSLRDVYDVLTGARSPGNRPTQLTDEDDQPAAVDFAEVRGNHHARRALEVVAAGGHNIVMTGAPGSGKTMLARALWGIMPLLTSHESLMVAKIRSVAGVLGRSGRMPSIRPFCAPHHTTSLAGLVGGGAGKIRPGMITMAHHGILFLDEFPEFGTKLDVLRQPLEDGHITISRAHGSVCMPADFMLVAARNPCPCGWRGDRERSCTCTPQVVERYQRRISGPILDRIDIHLAMPRIEVNQLLGVGYGEASATIQQRVISARDVQLVRQGCDNASLRGAPLKRFAEPDAAGTRLLELATSKLQLSARAYFRILRVARTIADLANESSINEQHVAEALQYRGDG
ncbi:MAG: YifB family Mg chelatase-like AAA ATPase [Chloroflexi bacterium]|nr:YifB family Mg chelatase-like AAA ATPase [Chloroflexota bacterium]